MRSRNVLFFGSGFSSLLPWPTFLLITLFVVLSCQGPNEPEDQLEIPELPTPDHVTVDTYATWSPDGTMVAYYRFFASSAGPPGIYLIKTNGTDNRLLLEGEGPAFWLVTLRFAPEGSKLCMVIASRLYLFDIDSSQLKQLTGDESYEPDWSPDGTSIVCRSPSGLRIVDTRTGEQHPLTDGRPIFGANPRWSPMGEPIAFWSGNRTDGQDIFTIRSDGSDFRRLTNTGTDNALTADPRWLYAGTHLLYYWRRDDDPRVRQTRIMRADGSDITVWPVLVGYFDAISPDSRQIVTVAAQPDTHTIDDLPVWVLFLRDLDDASGTSMRQLSTYSPPDTRRLY